MLKIRQKNVYILIAIIVLSFISLYIIRRFVVPLIFTGILVFLFHPLYNKIRKFLKSHFLTSIFSIIIILTIIIIPTTLTILEVSKEFTILSQSNVKSTLNKFENSFLEKFKIRVDLYSKYENFLEKLSEYFSELLYNKLPQFIFNIFIIIFFFYYFIQNYEKESEYFKFFFSKTNLRRFNCKIQKLLNGIIYGQVLVRLIQVGIGTILFFLIGVKGAFLWGFLMFFASFIPMFGTALIWLPISFINILRGDFNLGIFVFLIGVFISIIDNILMPYIISEKINIGPVITLISILGGIEVFGIYGIIMGPFFLGVLFVLIEEFLFTFRFDNPNIKRYVWSEKQRKYYKSLKTNIAKKEYVRMINQKYVLDEKAGKKVDFR